LVEGSPAAEPRIRPEEWSSYLKSFIETPPSSFLESLRNEKGAPYKKPFLPRNLNITGHDLKQFFANGSGYNALESRFALDTYKVHYIEDTEDFHHCNRPVLESQQLYAKMSSQWKKKFQDLQMGSF